MSRSNIIKAFTPLIALTAFAACATTPANGSATTRSAQADANALPKPTAEMITAIKGTSLLEQANFWNQQYNIHPTDLDISIEYIDSLMAIKSYERAAEVATFTSVSFPENPDVFLLLGKAHRKNNDALGAAAAYDRAVELSPYDATPLAALAGILDSRGDHETAQLAYQRALALDPNRPVTLSNYAMSLTLVGKLEQADEALTKATDLPGATPAIRQNHALVLGLLGKFDEARAVALIDAPEGIAQRNTDFLKAMIGDNPQLKAIAQNAAQAPATTTRQVATAEIPASAPTTPVTTSALAGGVPREAQTQTTQVAQARVTTKPGLRLRSRDRTSGSK